MLHSTPFQQHPRHSAEPAPSRSCFARSTSPGFAGGGGLNNLPSRAAKRSGRGRPKAGGGPAACCTERRSNNTRVPLLSRPPPDLAAARSTSPKQVWGRGASVGRQAEYILAASVLTDESQPRFHVIMWHYVLFFFFAPSLTGFFRECLSTAVDVSSEFPWPLSAELSDSGLDVFRPWDSCC